MKYLVALLFALSLPVHAEFVDGNKLYSWLSGEANERLLGLGYVGGVFDGLHRINHCPPENVTLRQVSEMTLIALKNKPETRAEPASVLVLDVLNRYWPCAKVGKAL